MFNQISIMGVIMFNQISIKVFIQIFIEVLKFIQIFIEVIKFIQIFVEEFVFIQIFIKVFMIIQIFIMEVIKVKLMFNQISITFDIMDLSPMALFQLKDMMVISITGIRVSIKLIEEEYI